MPCIAKLNNDGKTNEGEELMCDCLPACWELSYTETLSLSRLLENSQLTRMTGLPVKKLAKLSVFFTERSARGFIRKRRHTFTDFLCEWKL